jgi:molecular chaperone GrpE
MKISKRESHPEPTRNGHPSQELNQQIGELTADLQRVHADFVNYKRRTEEDGFRQRELGKQSAVAQLLSIADSLEKAVHTIPKHLIRESWVEGIRSIDKQIQLQLGKLGVTRFEAKGQAFDPQFMDAISVEGQSGDREVVSEVIQEGYQMGKDIIRHAVVKVRRMK